MIFHRVLQRLRPSSASSSPAVIPPRSLSSISSLSILLLLLVSACLPLCSSESASSSPVPSSPASSSTAPPDVWGPILTSTTGRTDVWPDLGSSTGDDTNDHIPDMTSSLRCVALEESPILAFNQSVQCTIECKSGMSATAGKVSDYEWTAEESSDMQAAAAVHAVEGVRDWRRGGASGSSTTDVKFGSISNFTTCNDSKIIAFVYTAPSTGTVGILHVLAGPDGREIENSPIVFTLKAPPDSGNSTTPIITSPPETKPSFVSLSNPAFIVVCAVAVVLLLSAVLGGLWARRVFARKANEVRERQVSERQWAHSVPSLKARLDAPQPSTIRSPLLR